MAYTCETCGTTFPKLSQLLHHRRIENHWKKHVCNICGKCFPRKHYMERHLEKHQNENNIHCDDCGKVFSRQDNLQRHIRETHQVGGGQKRPLQEMEEPSAKRFRPDGDPRQFYRIEKIKDQWFDKYKTSSTVYKVYFESIEVAEFKDLLATIQRLFRAIFEDFTKPMKAEDLIMMLIQSPTLDNPIVIPLGPVWKLTVDSFLSTVERVLQSNEDFVIDESLTFEVTRIDMPDGGAQKRCKYVDLEKKLKDKRCIIRIQNNDELCCARAIVTDMARMDKHEKWNSIRQGCEIQKQLAQELHKKAGVPLGACGIDEIKKFQTVLPDYQIHVVSAGHFNGIIYDGIEAAKEDIFILPRCTL